MSQLFFVLSEESTPFRVIKPFGVDIQAVALVIGKGAVGHGDGFGSHRAIIGYAHPSTVIGICDQARDADSTEGIEGDTIASAILSVAVGDS